ncbi:unnamed protein product [Bursaphelenchus okinawaensis]|uniref:Polysaccharide biosynthesis domain-containing protein n=1 Tax=Bursaphelenchus okinawaensis TaxID=465554 RepID=A0A811JV38_9BILA|nr:unnamed protein product [Bursaphelenchus okinawaensis]CAG9084617.1 unnamed protein product [Bursaphelenchus okinawaensis]
MTDLRTQLCDTPENYINDPIVEIQWAEKAFKKAEVHTNLLLSSDTKHLKLCKEQDIIHEAFRKDFPELKVTNLTIEDLKGDNVTKWREFCMQFQEVKDYNFGSLLRLNADQSYTNENTVLVPQVIFYAIEIARNLEGINETYREKVRLHREESLKTSQEAV